MRALGAEQGRFGIERLMFHLAGVPTYIAVAVRRAAAAVTGDAP